MSVDQKRREISKGLSLTEIFDSKFKTYAVRIRMTVPFDIRSNPLYALAFEIISTTNRSYPEREDFSKALTDLYSAGISASSGRIGENYSLLLTLNCLCDDYTIGGEVISDKAADMLLDCILDPVLENGAFQAKNFELCRQDMLDDIEAVINNKRQYASTVARKYIFEGENSAFTPFDSKPFLEAATPNDVTEAFFKLLKTAVVDVIITGGPCRQEVKDRIITRLSSVKREPCELNAYISPSPIKNEVCKREEAIRASQCQLIMAYKTAEYNEYASKLFIAMLGSSPTSKLFENVRENLSLCYYCDAILNDFKGTFVISSGLDVANHDKAQNAIAEQVKALQNGDFSDEEIENAKIFLAEAYLSNYDSKYDLSSWYLYQFIKGTNDSPEEKGRRIKLLSREDIIREAKNYKLDTVLVCKPEAGGDTDEA